MTSDPGPLKPKSGTASASIQSNILKNWDYRSNFTISKERIDI